MAGLLPQTQREQAMVLIAVLALAGLGAYWVYVHEPRTLAMEETASRVERLELNIQRARAQMARGTVEQVRDEARRYAESLAQMRQLVPQSNEVPLLLEQISTVARRSGLDIGTVEPLGVEQGTDFDAHRYRLRVGGGYHAIAEFLTSVGSMTRIVAPTNVNMTARTASGGGRGGAPRATVVADFELQTFVARGAAPDPGGM